MVKKVPKTITINGKDYGPYWYLYRSYRNEQGEPRHKFVAYLGKGSAAGAEQAANKVEQGEEVEAVKETFQARSTQKEEVDVLVNQTKQTEDRGKTAYGDKTIQVEQYKMDDLREKQLEMMDEGYKANIIRVKAKYAREGENKSNIQFTESGEEVRIKASPFQEEYKREDIWFVGVAEQGGEQGVLVAVKEE